MNYPTSSSMNYNTQQIDKNIPIETQTENKKSQSQFSLGDKPADDNIQLVHANVQPIDNTTQLMDTQNSPSHPKMEIEKSQVLNNHITPMKDKLQPTDEAVEYLQLSLEEAFYLAYGLGCLKIFLPGNMEVCVCEKRREREGD